MTKQKQTKEEIISALELIVREPGFIYSLAMILRRDLFLDPSDAADINWKERISFQEANFLLGLLVKSSISLDLPGIDASENQIKRTYELLHSLHEAHFIPLLERVMGKMASGIGPEDPDAEYQSIFGQGDGMAEPIFYGGSGAYDFQYLEFAAKRYAADFEWLKNNRGLLIEEIAKITVFLKKQHEKKHATPKPKSFGEMCQSSLEVFCFNETDLSSFAAANVKGIIDNFSIVPGTVNQNLVSLGDYNQVVSHPIIHLPDGRFFLPVGFSLTQSLYESPFYWMGQDTVYKDAAFKHQGEAAEAITAEMLEQIFGKANVYKNVLVKKSKKETVTDIDVLAVMGNKAVIVQVKSKKLTELSRKGDNEQLKKDFNSAVQEAYDQGLLGREAVLKRENTLECGGKNIALDEAIDDAYILCVSLDHYPAVAHHVDVYLKKGVDAPFPIALSIFDLDILVFYLSKPHEFLYYLRQRISLSEYFKSNSEISLLGLHLRQKLYKKPEYDREGVDEGFAQLIDANFPAMKGHHPVTKAVERLHHKWKNENFDRLVSRIKEASEPSFTDAIFYLYDLSSDTADALMEAIDKTKKKGKVDGQLHDFTMEIEGGKSGISFMHLPDGSEKMADTLMVHAIARKYKTKADKWLALGAVAGSVEIIDSVAFNKQPWEEDAELGDLAKVMLKQGIPMSKKNPGEKLGRNELCFCGSNIKYKKCHGK